MKLKILIDDQLPIEVDALGDVELNPERPGLTVTPQDADRIVEEWSSLSAMHQAVWAPELDQVMVAFVQGGAVRLETASARDGRYSLEDLNQLLWGALQWEVGA